LLVFGRTSSKPPRGGLAGNARSYAPLGCCVGGVLEADDCIRLRTFLTLDDVELDVIALFQRLIPIQLNGRVVYEYIRPVIASDKSIALGVIEPLDLPFALCHRLLLSLGLAGMRQARGSHADIYMTMNIEERLEYFCAISTR